MAKPSSEQFIESFISSRVGDRNKRSGDLMGKLHLQTMLLDPPVKHPRPSHRNQPRRLSAREKKRLKLHELPRDQQQYEDFLPLHALWLGYMEDLLQLTSTASSAANK